MYFKNFVDNQYENAVDPETASALAQAGGTLLGGIVQNRQAQNLSKSDFEKNLEAVCGKKPIGLNIFGKQTKYQDCVNKYTEQQTALQQQQLALQEASLSQRSAGSSGTGENGGLGTGAIIGIAVGGLAVIGTIIYLVVKR